MVISSTITIYTETGPMRVEPFFRVGYFCTHPSVSNTYKGCWTVTHIPTGLAISRALKDAPAARDLARWTKEQFEKHGVASDATDPNFLLRTPEGRELSRVLLRRRRDLEARYQERAA